MKEPRKLSQKDGEIYAEKLRQQKRQQLAETLPPNRLLTYRKYERSVTEYYLRTANQKRILFLHKNQVLKILARDFPNDRISTPLVSRFLNYFFDRTGRSSFRVPLGHPLNPEVRKEDDNR